MTTQGGNCTAASLLGTITVNPNGALALSSAVGTENRKYFVMQTPINDIVYELVVDATNATVTGLPSGVKC